jgi:hypothetical protein
MARIRSVHPGLFTDEAFMGLTIDAPMACVLLIGLWGESDDQGVFDWKPLTLKARLLPAAAADVSSLLERLTSDGFIKRFEIDGRTYGAIRNFRKWQRPEKPKATHPLPDDLRQFVYLSTTSPKSSDNKSPTERFNAQAASATDGRKSDGNSAMPTLPVADLSPTGSGKPPQRKEEGGREGDSSSLRSEYAPSKSKRGKARSQIPSDWRPHAIGLAYAAERGVKVLQELPRFINHHQAKGNLMADWAAAWRTWCDNQVTYGLAPGKTTTSDQGLFSPSSAEPSPDDPTGIRGYIAGQKTEIGTSDGKKVAYINGYSVEHIADGIADAVHQAGGKMVARPNWQPLAEWLRDDLPADWDRFLGTIKRVARTVDGPIQSMRLFDAALRSERAAA